MCCALDVEIATAHVIQSFCCRPSQRHPYPKVRNPRGRHCFTTHRPRTSQHFETRLRLPSAVDGQTFQKQTLKTRTRTSTAGIAHCVHHDWGNGEDEREFPAGTSRCRATTRAVELNTSRARNATVEDHTALVPDIGNARQLIEPHARNEVLASLNLHISVCLKANFKNHGTGIDDAERVARYVTEASFGIVSWLRYGTSFLVEICVRAHCDHLCFEHSQTALNFFSGVCGRSAVPHWAERISTVEMIGQGCARRLKALPLQSTTSVSTPQFKALPSRMVRALDVHDFSPIPYAFGSWSLLVHSSTSPWLPIGGLPPTLSSAAHVSAGSKYLCRPSWLTLGTPVITSRLCSSPKSSFFLGLKLGSLLKNSHTSSFLSWRVCFSSTRVIQNPRLRRNSSGL